MRDPEPTDLQLRIEKLMRATKMTAADLAQTCEVSPSAVQQWLGKASDPTKSLGIKTAIKLERKTGYSAMWLSKGELPKMADKVIAAPQARRVRAFL